MIVNLVFVAHFLQSIVIITTFYFFIKLHLFNNTAKIASVLRLTKYYPLEMAKGVIELPLVVVLHASFCFLLIALLAIPIKSLGIHSLNPALYIPLGALLGIGMMGFSSLLCRAIIEFLRHLPKPNFPYEVKDWLVMTRSGWLRHYLHTLDALSLPLALLIVFSQICCEEVVFRGIFIHYFLPAGPWAAIIASTCLFMFMQLFHMPTLVSGIFPLVGSMIIGLINGALYVKTSNLVPLIIAHFTFFIVAVL